MFFFSILLRIQLLIQKFWLKFKITFISAKYKVETQNAKVTQKQVLKGIGMSEWTGKRYSYDMNMESPYNWKNTGSTKTKNNPKDLLRALIKKEKLCQDFCLDRNYPITVLATSIWRYSWKQKKPPAQKELKWINDKHSIKSYKTLTYVWQKASFQSENIWRTGSTLGKNHWRYGKVDWREW